ncbi:MAG: hypothetical protein ABNH03_07205 [Alteromonas sp.]|jgi:methyl-accepting chemotaxis protein|uniref:hypothetical protein n=1 Tax=Alteromonas sp. TaxID=232 RepID=UPI0032D9531E
MMLYLEQFLHPMKQFSLLQLKANNSHQQHEHFCNIVIHDSTGQISKIIELLQEKTNSAVGVMQYGKTLAEQCVEKADIAGKALEKVTVEVSAISEKNYMIASAADEQKTVSEEINRNAMNINGIARDSTEDASLTL